MYNYYIKSMDIDGKTETFKNAYSTDFKTTYKKVNAIVGVLVSEGKTILSIKVIKV